MNFFKKIRRRFYKISPTYRLVNKNHDLLRDISERIYCLKDVSNNADSSSQTKSLLPSKSLDAKCLLSGERQVAKDLNAIRGDHLGRYEFAKEYLRKNQRVLDISCGVGYGTYILAKAQKDSYVVGIDISEDAVDYANRNYKTKNNHFICANALEVYLKKEEFDFVISFETIEHIAKDKEFLDRIYRSLKKGGVFICSTPNQELMPFDKNVFLYHVKHYKPQEMKKLLESRKFKVLDIYSQKSNQTKEVNLGVDGVFNIFVCKK